MYLILIRVILLTAKVNNKGIVLTFDGFLFKCQKRIADCLLAPRDIKAMFFVPRDFVGLTESDAFETYKTEIFSFYSAPKISKTVLMMQ